MYPFNLKIRAEDVDRATAEGRHDEFVMGKVQERINEVVQNTLGVEDAAKVSITQTGTSLQAMNFRFAGPQNLVKKAQDAINAEMQQAKESGEE